MKKLLLLAIIGFSAAAFAQDEIYYPEYENSVSFYASFDAATADADISEGRERPIAVLGKLKFVDGLRGKALFCGKGGLFLERNPNFFPLSRSRCRAIENS